MGQKSNKKSVLGLMFMFLFVTAIALVIFIRQYSHMVQPLLIFTPLLALAVVYAPIYILRVKNREKGARFIHYTVILSVLIAACGGVTILTEHNEAGTMMIIASGIINVIVSCWALVYQLIRIYKKKLKQKEEQIDFAKSFLYAIPMWYFPFLVNSIFH